MQLKNIDLRPFDLDDGRTVPPGERTTKALDPDGVLVQAHIAAGRALVLEDDEPATSPVNPADDGASDPATSPVDEPEDLSEQPLETPEQLTPSAAPRPTTKRTTK